MDKSWLPNNVILGKYLLGIMIHTVERDDKRIRNHPLLVLESQFSVKETKLHFNGFGLIYFYLGTCLFAQINFHSGKET